MLPGTTISVDALAQALVALAANGGNVMKAVSGTPDASYMHGIGGLFSTPGLDQRVFSAMLLPSQGLMSRLPAFPSDYDQPLFAILTGQTATTGPEPSAPCGTYPEIGNLKRCAQMLPFGRRGRATQVIDLKRVGRMVNRGEMADYQLIGNPFGQPGMGPSPNLPGMDGTNNVLNDEIKSQMFKLGVAMQRDFARDLFVSTPWNNPSPDPNAMTKYYYGLESLVNTGYKDAQAGSLCPAADSLVRNFGNQNISVAGSAGPNIVTELVYQYRYVNRKAQLIGVSAEWKWVIKPQLFYELTSVWPCSYYTNRCTTAATGNTNFTDAKAMTEMRDEMRIGSFLWIDGQKVEVIQDVSAPETELGNGTFAGETFLVPWTVDGVPSIFLEYFNYNGQMGPIKAAAAMLAPGFNTFQASDGGRFLITYLTPTGTCVQFQAESETRLILRTPFLATRTINIRYTPAIPEASPFPDSSYFQNGGITNTNGLNPYFYPIN
jgi:hypothetical protein